LLVLAQPLLLGASAQRDVKATVTMTTRGRRLAELLNHLHRNDTTSAQPSAAPTAASTDDAVALQRTPLVRAGFQFTEELKAQLDLDGSVVLPGLMTPEAVRIATETCARVQAEHETFTKRITPQREAHAARVAAATTEAVRNCPKLASNRP
jgi:hypothetical protein